MRDQWIKLHEEVDNLKRALDDAYGPIMRKILIKVNGIGWNGLLKILMPICVLIRQIRKGGKKMKPKWLYRLEYKDNSNGLWYNGNGDWCFNEGIGQLDDTCQTKTLPMDYDWRYKQDGKDWFSSCSNKEDLLHWYSIEDAKKLLENGFVFTRYLAKDYHEYENETVFLKETILGREVIDIVELFNESEGD